MSKFTVISTAPSGDFTISIDPKDLPSIDEIKSVSPEGYDPFFVIAIKPGEWNVYVCGRTPGTEWNRKVFADSYAVVVENTTSAVSNTSVSNKIGWLLVGAAVVVSVSLAAKKLLDD